MTENYETYAVSGTSTSESGRYWEENVPVPSYWGKQSSSADAFEWQKSVAHTPTPELSEFHQIIDLLAKKAASIVSDALINSGNIKELVEEHIPAKSGRRIERV